MRRISLPDAASAHCFRAGDPAAEGALAVRARGEVCSRNGQGCGLSKREAALLHYLASQAGRTVSRDEILTAVWRLNPHRTVTRTIDMHVAHLREKLGDNARQPKLLLTVHGYGYMLVANGGTGEPAFSGQGSSPNFLQNFGRMSRQIGGMT